MVIGFGELSEIYKKPIRSTYIPWDHIVWTLDTVIVRFFVRLDLIWWMININGADL